MQAEQLMPRVVAHLQRGIAAHVVGLCKFLGRETRLGLPRRDAAILHRPALNDAVEMAYVETLPALHHVPETDVDLARALGQQAQLTIFSGS